MFRRFSFFFPPFFTYISLLYFPLYTLFHLICPFISPHSCCFFLFLLCFLLYFPLSFLLPLHSIFSLFLLSCPLSLFLYLSRLLILHGAPDSRSCVLSLSSSVSFSTNGRWRKETRGEGGKWRRILNEKGKRGREMRRERERK